MPSSALDELFDGLEEVGDLQRANPTPRGGMPERPRVVRAINRSSVVLLYSHFERYIRTVNEEAVEKVNSSSVLGNVLPERMRLRHSQVVVDRLFATQWDNRSRQLSSFVKHDAWLWGMAPKSNLEPDRLVQWMKSVEPKRITRLFELWGIPDVFGKVTRKQHTRQRMWLKLTELVEKRHSIAHGDAGTEATWQDICSYISVVRRFCTRADRLLGRTVSRYVGGANVW